MATIIHTPDQHRCAIELHALGNPPIGTIAQCSCGSCFKWTSDYRNERYWELRVQAPGGGTE